MTSVTSETTHTIVKNVMTGEPNQSSSWPLSRMNSSEPKPEASSPKPK